MEKYPILILHGWNLSGKTFRPLVSVLKKRGYEAFAPDMPGFGRNKTVHRPLRLNDYVSFVRKYLAQKRIDRIILIGHSFGGRVAIAYTSRYGQTLSNLILTGVPGYVPASKGKITSFLLLSKIGKIIFSAPILSSFQTVARKILYRLAGTSDYMHTQGDMRETFKNIIKEDLTFYMKSILTPTLLIWGESDTHVSTSIARLMHKTIRNSKLKIIPDAGHNVPYEKPQTFFEEIRRFIHAS